MTLHNHNKSPLGTSLYDAALLLRQDCDVDFEGKREGEVVVLESRDAIITHGPQPGKKGGGNRQDV